MIRDRVQQTTTTSGTGTLQLDGPAPAGYLAFASVFTNGASVYYCVIDGNNWEVGEGVFSTGSPPTLSRLRVLASSNGGSLVSFTGAAKQVFSDAPAELLGAMAGRLKAANTAGGTTAYTLTLPVPVAGPTLVDHMEFSARINAANTGAVTLAVNGGTAKNVRKLNGKPLVAGDWFANYLADFRYDLTNDCYLWMNAPEIGNVKTISTTTYNLLAEDHGVLLRFTNAAGCAVAMSQALPTNSFAVPFNFDYLAQGGAVTFTPSTSTIDGGSSLAVAKGKSGQIRSDGTNYWTKMDAGTATPEVPVRQTTLSSSVDANGQPNFISIGSGLAVNVDGNPVPLIVTAANGFDANGAVDRVGIQSTDTSITGLTANSTNYLYADIAADGSITFGKTTLAPVYQLGGTYSVTNGQFTYNIAERVGKVGNGSVANQTYRVFIGEAVTNASNVTSVVNYALQGLYVASWTTTLPGANTPIAFNSNIGTMEVYDDPQIEIECVTTNNGFAVGDRMKQPMTGSGGSGEGGPFQITLTSRNTIQVTTGASAGFESIPKGGGAAAVLTAANWKYRLIQSRGW